MKTQDRPLDEDDLAMADLADVADWTRVAGPDSDASGPAVVRALVQRVTSRHRLAAMAARGRRRDRPAVASWGFTTRRGSDDDRVRRARLLRLPERGWSAYEIEPDDIPAAEAGLDQAWPDHLELARKHFGDPDYVGDESSPTFLDEWARGAARTGGISPSGFARAPRSTSSATSPPGTR